ncbi:MAG: hypothetical protein O3B08_13790 [Proteobacteria bacterium]|nr:hypothetical protein [Pseudomonadota bacterium]
MPPKRNPLNLNKLQLKTLILLQELAKLPDMATPNAATGAVTITGFPPAHGNHFHMGPWLVMGRDATGLHNEAVWRALERKDLAQGTFPVAITLSPAGIAYETHMQGEILHGSDH